MASKPVAGLLLNPILRRSKIISPSILRPHPLLPRTLQPAARRFAHAIPRPPGHPTTPSEKQRARRLAEHHYQLTFTCVPCGARSTHEVSKTGYHHGSVLITCPQCRNRHIISDHLNIFGDRKITVEDLMREKGQLVKRGTLGETGDVEFWEDKDFDADESQPESAEAQDYLDDVSEEEATRSRETRDPSSQTTDPKPTASTSLGGVGARPSIGSSQHTNPAPSTRRQYSTAMICTFNPGISGHDFLKASMGEEKSYSDFYQLSQEYITGPRTRRLREALRLALAERRGTLTRIPREEMLQKVIKVYAKRYDASANAGSQDQRTSGETVEVEQIEGEISSDACSSDYATPWRRKEPAAEKTFTGVRFHKSYAPKRFVLLMKQRNIRVLDRPLVRRLFVQDRYGGVRLYKFPTVDGRPQYIRTGPGPLYQRSRPTPWTGHVEEQDANQEQEQDADWLELDIPFQWEMPPDVPDGADRTVYPTTARGWPKPRTPSYSSVYQNSEEKIHFYEAMAVRRAVNRSKTEKMPVPLYEPPRSKRAEPSPEEKAQL